MSTSAAMGIVVISAWMRRAAGVNVGSVINCWTKLATAWAGKASGGRVRAAPTRWQAAAFQNWSAPRFL